ncbi:MAG: cation transporter [Gammaproteobacteria bacterium]|nr:cation transporter [Gammaproteobacteria bacterium]
MKYQIETLLALCALIFTITAWADQATTMNLAVETFAVENMTCAACPITVRKAMENVEGVKKVTVDIKSNTAIAEFDNSQTDANEIAMAATNVGFPTSVVAKEGS